ncbi:hypothetical protein [Stieleria maiorica]|nr:hypothetical protein [Stieleria maiorica]
MRQLRTSRFHRIRWICCLLLAGLGWAGHPAVAQSTNGTVAPPDPNTVADRIQSAFENANRLHLSWTLEFDVVQDLGDAAHQIFGIYTPDQYAIAFDLKQSKYREFEQAMESGEVRISRYWNDGETNYSQAIRKNADGEESAENYHVYQGGDERHNGQREQACQYLEFIGSPFYDGIYMDVWRREAVRAGAKTSEAPRDVEFSIIQGLRSGAYEFKRTEKVDGIPCHVWERPGRDTLFLAPEYSFALVKRLWRWADGGELMMRYLNSDFRSVAPGLWLPWKARREFMVDRNTHSGHDADTVQFATIATLQEVVVGGKVSQGLFEPKPVVGSTVMDNTIIDSVGGERATLSYVLGEDVQATERSINRALARITSARRRNILLFLLAGGAIAVIFAVVRANRKKHVRLSSK